MIEPERQFEALSELARCERPPSVDVAGRVLAILAAGQSAIGRATISERLWMWLAAAASAVAVPAGVLAIVTSTGWNDPLAQIFTEISWVMQ